MRMGCCVKATQGVAGTCMEAAEATERAEHNKPLTLQDRGSHNWAAERLFPAQPALLKIDRVAMLLSRSEIDNLTTNCRLGEDSISGLKTP